LGGIDLLCTFLAAKHFDSAQRKKVPKKAVARYYSGARHSSIGLQCYCGAGLWFPDLIGFVEAIFSFVSDFLC
jgi:hypothetical protein